MDNAKRVSFDSFRYRFFTREAVGLFVTVLAVLLAGITLTFLKIPNAYFYTIMVFLGFFVIQILFILLPTYLEFTNLQYVIEQNSISLKKGVFSVETETIPFQKIKNSSFDQTFVQRLFSVGNIIIDQDDEKFIWESIDKQSASVIMEAVAAKSNIQPIAVSA